MDDSHIEVGGVDEQDDDRPRTTAVRLLGTRIVASGPGYRPGDVLRLDAVMDQIKGSRALAREVLQALQHKGLVTLKTRVGATVQPVQNWNVLDHDVISWRLKAAPRFPMRSMTELREAIEPRAAFLAAQRASADVCRDLVNLAVELKTLAEDERFEKMDDAGKTCREAFRAVDAKLHRMILKGSNNEMFRSLTVPVEAALDHRIKSDWAGAIREDKWANWFADDKPSMNSQPGKMKKFPHRPEPLAMWLHYGVVYAIDQGHPQAAETFSRAIIAEYHNGQLNDSYLQNALLHALRELDLSGFTEADRDPFFEAVIAVAAPDHRLPTTDRKQV
ncbi:MAG: FadR family transcriptional regulator [Pseudonocardiales bacterium]|nr:FadR family transcriptional regulator [Pseudonocardiales bacterium]